MTGTRSLSGSVSLAGTQRTLSRLTRPAETRAGPQLLGLSVRAALTGIDPVLGSRHSLHRFYFKDGIRWFPPTGSKRSCRGKSNHLLRGSRTSPAACHTFTLNGTKVCGLLAASGGNYDHGRFFPSPVLWHMASLFFC